MNPGAAVLFVTAMWLLAPAAAVSAAQVTTNEITRDGDRYDVTFDVRIAAPSERLMHYLTDYANYDRYFQSIRESTVLDGAPDNARRVRLRLRACVWFFCRTVTFVKDVTEAPNGEIRAQIEPTLSDFQEATEYWRVTSVDGQTQLRYRAALVPDFFVPPLIGPWLLKRQIHASLISGAEKLETLAAN
ncbi:MAG TPA: SRPBCC family protein [Burkholderiales bacterium]|nr:SRPBCC family protein [Burkholderiales bacterium]